MEFNSVQDNIFYINLVFILYLIGNVIIYLVLHYKKINYKEFSQCGKRIMFVISHPDDECMFFGPSILKFTKQLNTNVYVLCLSNGDYYKEGNLRKQELWDSCSILGVPSSNIILYRPLDIYLRNHQFYVCHILYQCLKASENIYFFEKLPLKIQKITELPDNPKVKWSKSILINIITGYVERLRVDTVCTFDKYGISSHLNHKSVFYALTKAYTRGLMPAYCKVYCLDTVNIYRKYSSILDVLFTLFLNSNCVISSFKEFKILKAAMSSHRSQYIWFRKLYIHFSRYSFINSYTVLEKDDAELHMLLPTS